MQIAFNGHQRCHSLMLDCDSSCTSSIRRNRSHGRSARNRRSGRQAARKEEKTSTGRKPCIFCQRTDRKITNEDVIPIWTRDYFPDLQGTDLRATDILPFGAGEETRFRYTSRWPDPKVNAVCDLCNNGWMALKLERLAKSTLGPLLRWDAAPRTLSPADQVVLSAWAVKTVMAAEYLAPENVRIPEAHRDLMCESQQPARNSRVWIARHTSSETSARFRCHPLILKIGGARLLGGQSYEACLSIYAVVFRVLGTTEAVTLPLNAPSGFAPCWPVSGPLPWPPSHHLSNAEFDAFFTAMP